MLGAGNGSVTKYIGQFYLIHIHVTAALYLFVQYNFKLGRNTLFVPSEFEYLPLER
jgi:hypothetical protein